MKFTKFKKSMMIMAAALLLTVFTGIAAGNHSDSGTFHVLAQNDTEDSLEYKAEASTGTAADDSDSVIVAVDNSVDFASMIYDPDTADISAFRSYANEHFGQIINFDGYISSVQSYFDSYGRISDNAYNIYISCGDADAAVPCGPKFEIENVTEEELSTEAEKGSEVTLTAQILGYDEETDCIIISVVSVKTR